MKQSEKRGLVLYYSNPGDPSVLTPQPCGVSLPSCNPLLPFVARVTPTEPCVFLYPKREQPWNFKTSPLPSVLSLQLPPGNVSTFKAVPFTQEQSIYCLHVSSLPSSLISLTDLWNQCGLNETYHLLWSIISDSTLILQCYICWSAGGEQRRYFETLGKECNWLMERRVKWWTHSIRHLIMRHRWQNMYLLFGIYEIFIKN